MVSTRKFSEFIDGGNLEEGSNPVGLEAGQNARFTTLPQFEPAGTTAERPDPATAGMIRYNTDLNAYEFYNGTIWTQIESSADISLLIARLAAHTSGDGASMIGLEDQGAVSDKTVQDMAEANFLVVSDISSLVNAISMAAQSSGIFVNENGNGTPIFRSILGTANQLEVTNGDGVGGNIILNIAPNPQLAGNQSVLIPAGTTAQRPAVPVAGMVRYNTDLDDLEFYNDTALAWEQTASTGALTAIVQDTTPQLGGELEANGFDINMQSQNIINLLDPVNAQDAATKNYVDNFSSCVFITSASASSSASLDFTDLTGYAGLIFQLSNIVASTSGSSLGLQVSTDNGATFLTTAGDYRWVIVGDKDDGTSSQLANSSSARFRFILTSGNSSSQMTSGYIQVPSGPGPGFATGRRLLSDTTTIDGSGVFASCRGACSLNTTVNFNAIRFLFDAGNITSGLIRVFGIKES